ncbi:MAG: endolytic transglycosylase MltG [Patescibacteria group bacterium]
MNRFKILFLLLFLLLLLVFFWWFLFRPVTRGAEDSVFVINRGDSASLVASRLESGGFIRNRWVFLVYVKLTGTAGNIQAGSFRVKKGVGLPELVGQLTKGRLDNWVTLLEGWRREEMAQRVETDLGVAQSDFMQASRGHEGFLFPDSYLFPVGVGADKVVEIMMSNFDNKWIQIEKQSDLSQKQVVILASLIEREARKSSDRALVAGILLKRLASNWPLQVDATVQYAKASIQCSGEIACNWWPVVSRDDLKISSPYNTYTNESLPPSPICNPSLSSIEAVINPTKSDYWFYLTDETGQMYFARTLEEHNENIHNFL